MSTTTNLSSLVINYLTQSQYDAAAQAGTLNENQIYLTPAVEFTETDPTVPSWAKQTNKPSYNFSEIGSTPTTLSGYGITNVYTKTEVDGLVSGVLHYKGTKTSSSALPSSGNTTGDVWHVTDTGAEYAWDGSTWQELGTAVDLSGYLLSSEISSWAKQSTKPSYALSELTGAADVQAIEGLTGTSGFLKKTAADTWTLDTNTYLTSASTLDATKLSGTIPSGCYTDTNTTYTLSNALTSHKFTSTLTAGGSGSGTSTATMEFVAGTGITLTDDTTNKKITIANNGVTKVTTTAGTHTAITNATGAVSFNVPTKTSHLTNDSGFITSYTETDPVFSASAAAGITSTDISNWNAKVSDDKTWNGVSLTKTNSTSSLGGGDIYIPYVSSASGTEAKFVLAGSSRIANSIATYTSSGYLTSLTPSANDNSTKVATTAYVDAAIPKVYSSTNTGGYLTMATLPIYDGTVV